LKYLSFLMASAAVLIGAALAPAASALPGDLPTSPLSPADGSSVPALGETIKVTFACPAYRLEVEFPEEAGEVEAEEAQPLRYVLGGVENYGVVFSTTDAVAADGKLESTVKGEATAIPGSSNCSSEYSLPNSPNPTALAAGTVYWQGYRECTECVLGYEVGSISTFHLTPTDEAAELAYAQNVFGGLMTRVRFAGEASLKGAQVLLQRWNGSQWTTLAEEPGSESGENTFFVKLGSGHQLLRPYVVGNGVALSLEAKSKTVRKAKRTGAVVVSGGEYLDAVKEERKTLPLSFSVNRDGTELRGLSASVNAVCLAPTAAQNVTIEAKSSVQSARIAPDGGVVAHFTTTGATPSTVTLEGRFFNGRFVGVLSSSFLGNCFGNREFEAVKKG
jgi:hypothetical protein